MNRRSFIRLAGGGVVLAATGFAGWQYARASVFGVPAEAIAGWQGPAQGLGPRATLLSYAILAPNPHNMQPWIADLSEPGVISIRHDTDRLLPATDPFSRQILMGLGCFLETLELAAGATGQRVEVELFPDAVPGKHLDGGKVARVVVTEDTAVRADPLFAQVLNRRTDRRAYDPGQPPTREEIAALIAAAGSQEVHFGIETEPARVQLIRAIARRAWNTEITTEAPFMESMKVLRIGTHEIARHRDGLTIADPFLVSLTKLGLFDRSEMPALDSVAITSQLEEFARITASTPAYLWIVSDENSRAAQVAAGRAYVRSNLAATGLGLSLHPNQQSLQEYPEVAQDYAAIHGVLAGQGQTVQMLARLGRVPGGAALPPSPRRAAESFLA